MLALLRRTHLLRQAGDALGDGFALFTGLRIGRRPGAVAIAAPRTSWTDILAVTIVGLGTIWGMWHIANDLALTLGWADVGEALLLGAITLARVASMMVLAILIWVPVGVWLGLRPAWSRIVQPLAQFLAAFPANLLFPPFVIGIVAFRLDPDIWLTPLMVLGTQWYLLFNVIAGAASFPGDLQEAARNLRVGGFLWWRRVILPGILPHIITGAITASGGSWNASIVAEVAAWGDTKLAAHGLGAFIAQATDAGDVNRVILGVVVMSVYVLGMNRLIWRPLAAHATRRATHG
jgi:NitT/TauT family transport system permease protein